MIFYFGFSVALIEDNLKFNFDVNIGGAWGSCIITEEIGTQDIDFIMIGVNFQLLTYLSSEFKMQLTSELTIRTMEIPALMILRYDS